jgi:hypothetical protein
MKRSPVLWIVGAICSTVAPCLAQEGNVRYERRWVYLSHNLLVDQNADAVVALLERAGKAGYNGALLSDYKFNILDRMPSNYFRNVERVKKAAEKAHIELVPAIFPIGYSDGWLAHDPNLAEGLLVESAPFVVKGREAALVDDPTSKLRNGDLEQVSGDKFVNFGFQDDPGKVTFADRQVVHGGKISCRIEDTKRNSSSGNARLVQLVKVRPNACYRFSAWVKTKQLEGTGAFHLLALGAGEPSRQLTFHEAPLKPDQDWTLVEVVFNSLDQKQINLYVGLWGGQNGTLWLDDLKLEELSLVNVLRRRGCPLVVAAGRGEIVYEEGRDFDRVVDDKLGVVPYAGQYDFAHAGPKIQLTARSRIKDGDRLRVTWYHPILTHGEQMMCCLSEPKVYDLLRDQAKRINALFHPKTVFMSHDEIRVINWCQACRSRKLSPGKLLADNVRRCVAILKDTMPRATVATWSDMFDPNHNAVKSYYLVNGSLEGSWEGLAPAVLIANWNSGKAHESLDWFARRGHSQIIAGYYDADDLSNFRTWNAAAKGVPKISGFMYTTWQSKFELLEKYGNAMRGK